MQCYISPFPTLRSSVSSSPSSFPSTWTTAGSNGAVPRDRRGSHGGTRTRQPNVFWPQKRVGSWGMSDSRTALKDCSSSSPCPSTKPDLTTVLPKSYRHTAARALPPGSSASAGASLGASRSEPLEETFDEPLRRDGAWTGGVDLKLIRSVKADHD